MGIVLRDRQSINICAQGNALDSASCMMTVLLSFDIYNQSCFGNGLDVGFFYSEGEQGLSEEFMSLVLLETKFGMLMDLVSQLDHVFHIYSVRFHEFTIFGGNFLELYAPLS